MFGVLFSKLWCSKNRTVSVNGTVAEGLGRGLQNLLQQFESARYLQKAVLVRQLLFLNMLSQQEKDFLRYWEENRLNKKRFLRQFSIGLPVGVLIVVLVFVNLLSGWYKKAEMQLRSNSSLILVVIFALVIIAVFIAIFSSNHKWEQNEQRYQELKRKADNNSEKV